jgi:hypothetical protein
MRHFLLATVLLIGFAASSCATMFSGTTQDVRITGNVENANCVVLGGYLGSILSTASQVSEVAQAIFDILDPVLDPEDREALRKIDINEVIAYVGVSAAGAEMPPELAETLVFLQRVPNGVIKELVELFSVMDYGPLPRKVELKRAKTYAVVAWADGYKAGVEIIGIRPNFVTLWNVLNFGLGFFVDFFTGAWSNLEDPIRFNLRPLTTT